MPSKSFLEGQGGYASAYAAERKGKCVTRTTREGLWTTSFGELGATLKALQDAGVTSEHLKRLRSDSTYRGLVTAAFLGENPSTNPQTHELRAMLNNSLFDLSDWQLLFNGQMDKTKLPSVPPFPWDTDVLNEPCPFVQGKTVRETHFAFLGLDHIETVHGFTKTLTITGWQTIYPQKGRRHPRFHYDNIGYGNRWYQTLAFASEATCQFRWYLMPTRIIPGSRNKTFEEQQTLLPAGYEIPLAIEELTKQVLYFIQTGRYSNPEYWAQCRDVIPGDDLRQATDNALGLSTEILLHSDKADQSRTKLELPSSISTIRFDSYEGLSVDHHWPQGRHPLFGLAASRKLPDTL